MHHKGPRPVEKKQLPVDGKIHMFLTHIMDETDCFTRNKWKLIIIHQTKEKKNKFKKKKKKKHENDHLEKTATVKWP